MCHYSLWKMIHVNGITLHYVSLLVAWISISVGIFFLAKLFEGLVNIATLGIFNKIAGAVFGGLKYIFILCVLIFFLNLLIFDSDNYYLSLMYVLLKNTYYNHNFQIYFVDMTRIELVTFSL